MTSHTNRFDAQRNRRQGFAESTFDTDAPPMPADLTGEVWSPDETTDRRIDWTGAICGAVLLVIGFFAWISI